MFIRIVQKCPEKNQILLKYMEENPVRPLLLNTYKYTENPLRQIVLICICVCIHDCKFTYVLLKMANISYLYSLFETWCLALLVLLKQFSSYFHSYIARFQTMFANAFNEHYSSVIHFYSSFLSA